MTGSNQAAEPAAPPTGRKAGKLIVAIPSKGRIMDEAVAAFARAGLAVRRSGSERGYRGVIEGLPDAEVAFLSSSEIAREVGEGRVHLGIMAVPRSWLDVASVADLESVGLAFRRAHGRRPRIATKFVNMTRRFLAVQGVTSYLVVESLGATEGTPAAGTAEIIVDITETGATLSANHLKVLANDILLESQSCLVRSRLAAWSPPATAALEVICSRLGAMVVLPPPATTSDRPRPDSPFARG